MVFPKSGVMSGMLDLSRDEKHFLSRWLRISFGCLALM